MAFLKSPALTTETMAAVATNTDEVDQKPSRRCCISHLFHDAALQSPDKVAVIHASGGATIARHSHTSYGANVAKAAASGSKNSTDTTATDDRTDFSPLDDFIASKTISSRPPIYEGDECFTFSDILSAVESLSRRLHHIFHGSNNTSDLLDVQIPESPSGLSVKKGNSIPRIVGIYMEPSVEYIVAVLAVLRCGEAFMPLDPSWPSERVLSLVTSSKTDIVIGHRESIDSNGFHKLDQLSWLMDEGSCPVLPVSVRDYVQEPSESDSSQLAWPCESESLLTFCYLMYTSGSTGRPKGVCGTEKGLLNRFLWMQEQYPLDGNELLLFKTPISFIDHLQEFLGALLTTCTLVIPPFSELKENIFYVVDFLQVYAINRFVAVPSLMRAILPVMQDLEYMKIRSTLKLLVLSGEVFPLTLWQRLVDLLPETGVLNLYGSTEVAGDCTYFDCKRLPLILENETPESVPIGIPISNCYVRLGEDGQSAGELYVGGECIAMGYYSFAAVAPLDCIKEHPTFSVNNHEHRNQPNHYIFRTGDFARQLQCGDFVFLGRKDRLIKVNGNRVSLEEIEMILKEQSDIVDAAVISSEGPEGITLLEAYLIRKLEDDRDEDLTSSIRSWMLRKLPLAMVPTHIYFRDSLPLTSSGKVDYSALAGFVKDRIRNSTEKFPEIDLIQNIEKVFCDALMVEKISINDDFFEMGGNSISAAFASHKLGINMKLLYTFSTPSKLQMALLGQVSSDSHLNPNSFKTFNTKDGKLPRSVTSSISSPHRSKLHARSSGPLCGMSKRLKLNNICIGRQEFILKNSNSMQVPCAFSRSNKVMHGGEFDVKRQCQPLSLIESARHGRGSMQEIWKVYMESCVDASPLVVINESDIYLFIGSHSYKFVCINANSGFVQWEIKLQGRIECSAAILDDFSQVVVGCYQGHIYFIDFLNGDICWSFQTRGEVKSQPVIDKMRHVVWCGSYDHNLYALDYKTHSCIYEVHCGGSIFSSPAIDEAKGILFVASTSGQMTAISLKEGPPFSILWVRELEAPIFGSLSINHCNGNVICCMVDGNVLVLDTSGSTVWKARTGGPIFGGPCISHSLPSQVLVCSRDGSIYSLNLGNGEILWEHSVGQPITSSAFVDENLQLASEASHLTDRLVCVCSSSGSIHVLRINMNASGKESKTEVEEFARLDLEGDIFSSPVMIGGRIFIGCRDDYVRCISLDDLRISH